MAHSPSAHYPGQGPHELQPPSPTVVLRHELPDGSAHWDWMIAPAVEGTAPLITFRLNDRPDSHNPKELAATRLPDHRRLYLNYEGPISGDRGHVRRVRAGMIVGGFLGPTRGELRIHWAAPAEAATVRLTLENSDQWRIAVLACEALLE
ncbi:MAG TPA: hypothetical protein PK400_09785 [Phycisphaerales bacterium]|nr:hypothetical protein [Phycisphaerales bacterium]HRQ75673.1 hypothetical protein [Phycisphaerales bacterium]